MLSQNSTNHAGRQKNQAAKQLTTKPEKVSTLQVYDISLLSEWILMSHYSAGDFKHRFVWPEMGPEVGRHFMGNAA